MTENLALRIEPKHISVGRLFGSQYIFRVPQYQRSFAWGEGQVRDFARDLSLCLASRLQGHTREHFFGSILCVVTEIPGSTWRECQVVDGQQRMCVFVILAECMARQYKSLIETARSEGDTQTADASLAAMRTLREKYLVCHLEINMESHARHRLEPAEPDREFLLSTVRGTQVSATRDSHRMINNAFRVLSDSLEELVAVHPGSQQKAHVLATLAEILDQDCTVVQLSTVKEAVAYRLFRVLNDRGTSLSEGDLLRARTLELLEKHPDQQQIVRQVWNDILSDRAKETSGFLSWYYSSYCGKRPPPGLLFDSIMDRFFKEQYLPVVTDQAADSIVSTVQSLHSEIRIMRRLAKGRWPYDDVDGYGWDAGRLRVLICELGHDLCIPLLLSAYHLGADSFAAILGMVERVFFRYKVICKAHATPLLRVYLGQSTSIRGDSRQYRPSSLRRALSDILKEKADDQHFRSQLSSLVYNPRTGNREIRYLLTTLEHYHAWYQNGANGQPVCRNKMVIIDFSKATVEHIYPRNSESVDPGLEELKDTLGNLTFLDEKENNSLGNKNAAARLKVLRRSSAAMNREIGTAPSWDSATVAKRTKSLHEMALQVFRP